MDLTSVVKKCSDILTIVCLFVQKKGLRKGALSTRLLRGGGQGIRCDVGKGQGLEEIPPSQRDKQITCRLYYVANERLLS